MNPPVVLPWKSGKPLPFPRAYAPAVFGFIALVYWWERSRGPGWGDSLGFLLSSLQGFSWTVNATGHLLYNTMIVALVKLLPWIDPVPLLTSLSILFALLTLVRIYQTSLVLAESRFAALMGAIAFGLSFTFWRQAEQVEVYTSAIFFTASAIYFMLADTKTGTYRHVIAAGVWLGLAVLVHIQTVLLIPLYILYLIRARQVTNEMGPALVSIGAVGAAFLLLIFPAFLLPRYTVASVFFDFNFRDEVVRFSIPGILAGFGVSIAYLVYSFHVHLAAAAAGFLACRRTVPQVFSFIMVGIVPIWVFAMRYPVTDQYVFFLNAYLFVAIFAAYGYKILINALPGKFAQAAVLIFALAASPAVYEAALVAAIRIPRLAGFHDGRAYKGGLAYYLRPGLRTGPIFDPADPDWAETGMPVELHDRLVRNMRDYANLLERRREMIGGQE